MASAGVATRSRASRRPAAALALVVGAWTASLLSGRAFVGLQPPAATRGSVARSASIIQVPGGMKNGLKLLIDGEPMQVVSFQSKKQGKGVAITKTKVKNLFTGAVIDKTLSSGAKFETIDTEWQDATYSYFNDADGNYVFMDSETFEELEIKGEVLGEAAEWLQEGMVIEVEQYNGRYIQIKFKGDVIVKVESIIDSGRTDGNLQVILENGLKKQGPGYLKPGDEVLISQETWGIKKRM